MRLLGRSSSKHLSTVLTLGRILLDGADKKKKKMKKPGFVPEDFPSLESGRGYSHGHLERTKFTGGDIAKLPGSPEKGSDAYVSHKGTGAG